MVPRKDMDLVKAVLDQSLNIVIMAKNDKEMKRYIVSKWLSKREIINPNPSYIGL